MIAQISSIEVEEQISPGANSPCGDGSYPRHSEPKIPMIERPPSTSSSRNCPRANATIHIIATPRSGNSTTRCPARAKKLCVSRRRASPCVPRALPTS